MLSTPCFIFNPASSGGGVYTFELFWQSSFIAQFLNIGDTIRDSTGNEYEVVAPTTIPNSDGNTITTQYITADVLPVEDTGFDSEAFTPGQVDLRPVFRTEGSIGTQSLFSGPDYEYTVTASWVNSAEANKAVVGDSIVDSSGKEYAITFLDTNRFGDPFRIEEVEKVGVPPTIGSASLYRPTTNKGFYQGSPLSDPARTTIFHRDEALTDTILKDIEDSLNSGNSAAIVSDFRNNTGGSLGTLAVVTQDSNGDIKTIDPSVEADVEGSIGVLPASISDGNEGTVVLRGLIKNVSTSFSIGDVLYLSKTGTLSTTVPDIGVSSFVEGDFVIKIGKITKNADNPTQKDLEVKIDIIGQL